MSGEPHFFQRAEIQGRDFANAGKASSRMKAALKDLGVAPEVIRRVAIAAYEAEMNVVLYARKGTMELKVTPADVRLTVADEGNGIADVPLAMQEGYSTASDEIRELGFGAGMGLPNIQKNADDFRIRSVVGRGTTLEIKVRL
ncbi:MAG: ATP-binding protein [Acidobacteriota bacterium]